MKFEKDTVDILSHFSKFAQSIHIVPGDPQRLYAAHESRRIVARARNVQDIDLELPIYNLGNFVSALSLFKGVDYDITRQSDHALIKSEDGSFEQLFYMSDPDVLTVPNPEKTKTLFESEFPVEFNLTSDFFARLAQGINNNGVENVIFASNNGVIDVIAADADSSGELKKSANQFKISTKSETSINFKVGIPASVISDVVKGDYLVSIKQNIVRFLAPDEGKVDYLSPTLRWSSIS